MLEHTPAGRNGPAQALPSVGTLMADRDGTVWDFRGEAYGLWYVRPLLGGIEWAVAPGTVRPATDEQQRAAENIRAKHAMRAAVLLANNRSRRGPAGAEPTR